MGPNLLLLFGFGFSLVLSLFALLAFLGFVGFLLGLDLLYIGHVHLAVVFLRLRLAVLLVHLLKHCLLLFVKTLGSLSILLSIIGLVVLHYMPFFLFMVIFGALPFLRALKSAPVILFVGAAAPAIFFCLGVNDLAITYPSYRLCKSTCNSSLCRREPLLLLLLLVVLLLCILLIGSG